MTKEVNKDEALAVKETEVALATQNEVPMGFERMRCWEYD